jgi:hypothetical protein
MDKRTNNGNKGHSTKAKGVDKRKNQYLHLLDEASTDDDVISVIKKLKFCALNGDVQAIKLFLEYYLGKPKETIDQNVTVSDFNIKDIVRFK